MLWEEVIRQLPELGPILEGKEAYLESEFKEIEAFVKGEQ